MNDHQPAHPEVPALLTIGEVVERVRVQYPTVTRSSLRFLEREGLIEPQRTPGGHRLYRPADVDRILQIKSWQDDRLSLTEIRERLQQRDLLPSPAGLVDGFLRHIDAGQLTEARALILHAHDVGVPLETLFGAVLQPVLYEVGRRWEMHEMLVSQEKEVSELVRDLIAQMGHGSLEPRHSGPILVAGTVQGESHELGLRMIVSTLRARGCRVLYLGANVAPEIFLEAASRHTPHAILLAVKLPPNIVHVGEVAECVRGGMEADACPLILVGGDAVPDAVEQLRDWHVIPLVERDFGSAVDAVIAHLASRT